MKHILTVLSICLLGNLFSQETKVYEHFRNTRIINLQSVESLKPGTMELKISHRFGAVSDGPRNLFGLDIATMRLALEQGLTENLMIGIGRSTTQKTYDGFVKWRIINQKENGIPFTMSYLSTISINGMAPDKTRKEYFSNKLAYVNQLIISSKINDLVTLQLSPTVIHKNLVPLAADKNTTFAIGFAATYNLTQHLSLNGEYIARIPIAFSTSTFTANHNSLSCGLGINTRGHFFELHLTNSMQMVEKGVITETPDTWLKGNIHPGFNMIRDFKVYKKK